jgi:hypothetical protein
MHDNEETGRATAPSSATTSAITAGWDSEGRIDNPERHGGQLEGAGADKTASEEVTDDLAGRFIALDFEVCKSLRYHAKRRAFFEACNHWTRALSAIFGAAAVAAAIADLRWVTIAAGVLIAIAQGLDLVLDFSKRATIYDGLYRRFADLAIELANVPVQDEATLRRFKIARLLIEKDEPTPKDILNVLCSNEERQARGYEDGFEPLTNFQRRFAQVLPSAYSRSPS